MSNELTAAQKGRFLALVLVLAILLTIVLTYPFARDWRTAVPGGQTSDASEYVWSFWWFEQALFKLKQSPAVIDWIYYPDGAYHPTELTSLYPKLATLPFTYLLKVDPFVAYNLNLLSATVLTMFFMAWLCLVLTGSRSAALVGGIIFAFCASRTTHILYGHFTQALTYFYPLLVLALWRLWQKPTLARGFVLGLNLALAALLDLMPIAYFFAPIMTTILLYFVLKDRQRFLSWEFARSLLLGIVLASIVVLPIFYPLVVSTAKGELGWYQSVGVVEFSADLLAFIVPPPQHPMAGALPGLQNLSNAVYGFGVSRFEATVYLGWMSIVLGLAGVLSRWKAQSEVRYWMTVAFASTTLALGPWLRVGGRIITLGGKPLIMPYAAILFLPFMSWGRTPGRLGLTAQFALAILAAFGVASLSNRVGGKGRKVLFAFALVALTTFDTLAVYPWPMTERRSAPDFYSTVAADRRSVALLDIPVEGYNAAHQYMYYQMEHGHAIVGGWRLRRSVEVSQKMQEYEALAAPGGDVSALAQAGIGYIILHKQFLDVERLSLLRDHLTGVVGPPVYDDQSITAFRLTGVAEIAPKPISVN
jgi:hypothetical protein